MNDRLEASGVVAFALLFGSMAVLAPSLHGCGGSRAAGDSTTQPGEPDQRDEIVTGVEDVACATHAVWPVPACPPSCPSETFHVELPDDDVYPPGPLLFLQDGRTLVALAGYSGAGAGQAKLVMLSADGTQQASATIEPCGEPVPVALADLDESGNGGFLLLAACAPGTEGQRVVLVRLDGMLAVTETEDLLFGLAVEWFSSSLAVLDGTPYLLYVTSMDENGPGTWTVHLQSGPGTEQVQVFDLVESHGFLSARPLAAEGGLLVFLMEGQVPGDMGGEFQSVLVVDGSGTVLVKLDSERYAPASGLDFRPKVAHVEGGDLVVAGQSWDPVIGSDGWPSREAVFERRKLDGTILAQARLAMGPQTDLSSLTLMPTVADGPATAAWLVVLADRHNTKSPDGGIQLDTLPRFTWLTPQLEARFGMFAPEGIPQLPTSPEPDCSCGYRMAWSNDGTLHVVKTNNTFRFGPDTACDDGLACTSDAGSDGVCAIDVATGCLGPDGCYDAGAPRHDNPCLLCGQSAECGSLWQPLVDKAACGFDGQCLDGRCRCEGRWLAVRGSSKDMHEVLAAGFQADGHVLVWTRASKVPSYPNGTLSGMDVSAAGDAVSLGSVAESWYAATALLVAEDATYAAVDGKLKKMDRSGATIWSAPLPTGLPPRMVSAADGIVQPAPDRVLAFYIGRKGPSVVTEAHLYSKDGKFLADGSWEKPFSELEGEVEMASRYQQSEDVGTKALALPDGRVLILAGALQVPDGTDIGLHHEFMVLVDENGKDATLKVLPNTHFAAATALGDDAFLTCRDLEVQEWTLEGEKMAEYDLSDAVTGGKDVVRSCHGLASGSGGMVRMLVDVYDKTSFATHGEVLVLEPDGGKLVQTTPVPLLPSWDGLSTLPDGGFLVVGSLDSGVAAVLRADVDGRYRCW